MSGLLSNSGPRNCLLLPMSLWLSQAQRTDHDLPEQADERTDVADVGLQPLLVHVGLRPLPVPVVQNDPIVAAVEAAQVPA